MINTIDKKKIYNQPVEVIFFLILSFIAGIIITILIFSFFPAKILVYPERLNFSLIKGGPKTGNQIISIEFKNKWTGGKADLNWIIYSKDDWLEIKPKSGKGKAFLNIGVRNITLKRKTYESDLIVYVPSLLPQKKSIKVRIKVYEDNMTQPPFGWMDLPLEGEKISGQEILIAGWALDDIEVEEIQIKREPLAGEQVPITDEYGLINLGQAPLLAGLRHDVEKLYPNLPLNYRASWGLRWETKKLFDLIKLNKFKLGNEENVPVRLYAVFKDKEGYKTIIGPRTVFLNLEKRKR